MYFLMIPVIHSFLFSIFVGQIAPGSTPEDLLHPDLIPGQDAAEKRPQPGAEVTLAQKVAREEGLHATPHADVGLSATGG